MIHPSTAMRDSGADVVLAKHPGNCNAPVVNFSRITDRLKSGVGAATYSRQLLDSRVHGDYSHDVKFVLPGDGVGLLSYPGRTYSRVRHTRAYFNSLIEWWDKSPTTVRICPTTEMCPTTGIMWWS